MKSPIRRTGLTCARGSWKIIATWLRNPRSAAPASACDVATLEADLALTSAPRGSSRSIARAVIDLPEPDSPTSPTASPGRIASETSRSTARFTPCTSSSTVSPSTSSSGAAAPGLQRGGRAGPLIGVPPGLLEQPLAKHVDRDDDGDDAHAGRERGQRVALQDARLVLRDHDAPVGRGRLHAKAEEGDRRQVDHRPAEHDRRLRDDERQHVGQHVPQADRCRRGALHLQGGDVGLAPFPQCGSAQHARDVGHVGDRERGRGGGRPGAEDGGGEHRQQDARERRTGCPVRRRLLCRRRPAARRR